jgi:NTE family protein
MISIGEQAAHEQLPSILQAIDHWKENKKSEI